MKLSGYTRKANLNLHLESVRRAFAEMLLFVPKFSRSANMGVDIVATCVNRKWSCVFVKKTQEKSVLYEGGGKSLAYS